MTNETELAKVLHEVDYMNFTAAAVARLILQTRWGQRVQALEAAAREAEDLIQALCASFGISAGGVVEILEHLRAARSKEA